MSSGQPKAAVEGERTPTDEAGIYLWQHEHLWVETRSLRAPRGTWHPVFVCTECGDTICDYSITDHADLPQFYLPRNCKAKSQWAGFVR